MTHDFFLSRNISEKRGGIKARGRGRAEWRKRKGQGTVGRTGDFSESVAATPRGAGAASEVRRPHLCPFVWAAAIGCSFIVPAGPRLPPPPEANLAPGAVGRGRSQQDSQDSAESLSLSGGRGYKKKKKRQSREPAAGAEGSSGPSS